MRKMIFFNIYAFSFCSTNVAGLSDIGDKINQ